jgi:hypothetical protein
MHSDGAPAAVVASAHVFRFRSLRDAARSLARDRGRLAHTEGLLFGRLVFVGSPRVEGFNPGVVDPRRQLALCLWRDEQSLERFRTRSPIGRSWRAQTDEHCEIRMVPFRTSGTYRGMEPLAGLAAPRVPEGPVAMWTFANIAPRHLWFFWNGIRRSTRQLLPAPSLVAGTAGPEHFGRGAMTFTIWRDLDSVLGYAYRADPHRQIVKDTRAGDRLIDSMFIRLEPYAVEGRWPAYSRFAARFEEFARALRAPGAAVERYPA